MDWYAIIILRWDVSVSHISYSYLISIEQALIFKDRYVAMHAMQDEPHSHEASTSNGYADGGGMQRKQPKPQMRDTFAAVGGMMIPLLTQIGHHH